LGVRSRVARKLFNFLVTFILLKMTTSISEKTAALELLDASKGFDAIFSDDIQGSIASCGLRSHYFLPQPLNNE
jgi:hypothetical protein